MSRCCYKMQYDKNLWKVVLIFLLSIFIVVQLQEPRLEFLGPSPTLFKPYEETLFYMSVPTFGQNQLLDVIVDKACQKNKAVYMRFHDSEVTGPKSQVVPKLVDFVINYFPFSPVKIFSANINYFQFTDLDSNLKNPSWFAIIMNPTTSFIAKFYFHRSEMDKQTYPEILKEQGNEKAQRWKNKSLRKCVFSNDRECHRMIYKDSAINYFCGFEPFCSVKGSMDALILAKKNLELHFPVVGVAEELNVTFRVMQNTLGSFFHGIEDIYWLNAKEKATPSHDIPRVPDDVKEKLTSLLALEFDFYNFATQRLKRQFQNTILN